MRRPLLLRKLVLLLSCLLSFSAVAAEKKKVRRSRAQPMKKAPKRLIPVPGGESLRSDAAAAFQKMLAAAREEGTFLWASSGYRTLKQQRRLYWRYKRGQGPRAARPGRSNHHLGIAVDIPVGGDETSETYGWLATHACRFGFQRTVPAEPWHWEYRPRTTAAPAEGLDCLGRPVAREDAPSEETPES